MQGAGLYVRGDAQSLKSAVEKCQDSFRLYESIGDKYGQGLSLYTAGLALAALGDNQKALDYFGQALPLRRAVGDRKGEADVLDNIGVVYDALSEQQKSLEYFTQALPVYRSIGDHGGEATALNNIGSQYDRLGDMQKGLEYYLQALELNHGTGSRMSEAATLDNIAVLYYELGELQKALDYESKALLLYRQLGHRIGEAAALNNMGAIYRDLGQNDKAIDYLQQALPVSRAAGDRDGEAATLTQIGRVYAILGQNPKALEYYQQALQLNRAVGDRDQEAGTLRRMADAYRALGENREALDSYGQALSLYHLIQDPLYEAGLLVSFMDYWKTQGKPSLAILFGKQGIDRFQEIRKNIQGLPKAEQESFVRSNEDYYRKLADLLVGQGRLPEAQEVLDLLKVEEYSEFSHRRGGPNSPVEPVTRTRTEQVTEQAGDAIQQDVIALGQRWLELKRKTSRTPEEETQFEQLSLKLDDANKRWKTYMDGLYDSFGKGEAANKTVEMIKAESSGLRNLLRGMDEGTIALYTLLLEDKCVIMVITPAAMVAREVPVSKLELRKKVFEFVDGVEKQHAKSHLETQSHELYQILIAPVEKDLEQAHARTLLWSLEDVLRYVPLAALYDGKQYLVERYANVVITTASIANLAQPQVGNWHGVAMGVSKDYDGLGELSAVPGELNAVVSTQTTKNSHGPVPGMILLDDTFTEKNLEAALEQPPPLLHIATHFVFNPGDEERSYLLLGGKDEGGKGYHLSLANLRNDSRLNNFVGVELLTLSACQTAMGSKDSDGREVDSLGFVSQLNGAKAVIATLWPVDDASVGILMENFYRHWIGTPGMSKSEALRQAQLALLHSTSETSDIKASTSPSDRANQKPPYAYPFYWAPFVLTGNWK